MKLVNLALSLKLDFNAFAEGKRGVGMTARPQVSIGSKTLYQLKRRKYFECLFILDCPFSFARNLTHGNKRFPNLSSSCCHFEQKWHVSMLVFFALWEKRRKATEV